MPWVLSPPSPPSSQNAKPKTLKIKKSHRCLLDIFQKFYLLQYLYLGNINILSGYCTFFVCWLQYWRFLKQCQKGNLVHFAFQILNSVILFISMSNIQLCCFNRRQNTMHQALYRELKSLFLLFQLEHDTWMYFNGLEGQPVNALFGFFSLDTFSDMETFLLCRVSMVYWLCQHQLQFKCPKRL